MSVREKMVTVRGEQVKFWIADYADGTGHRHQRRFKTKKEAAAHHDQLKTVIRAGQHVALPHDLTIAGAADKWLKKIAADGRERATLKTYKEHTAHILRRIGTQKLAKMTKGHVEAFRDGMLEGDKALSRDMAGKVLTSLKGILKANGVSHLGDNITVKNAKRRKLKLEAGRDIPTPDEVARLVKVAKPGRIRTLVMTAASTGLRASELRGLRWSDVDLKAGEIHVRQRADRFNQIGPPKSEGSARTVPIGPEVAHALKEWKIANAKHAYVFSTGTGTIDNHSNVLRSFETVQTAAGMVDKAGKPKYGMHALRHFFASWCINSRASGGRELPVKEVQTLLGHSSITMTLDVYGHLFPRRDDRNELEASERRLFHLSATQMQPNG
jgi:integrase